jgi:U3 small nucleolar RNA-associated protein 3
MKFDKATVRRKGQVQDVRQAGGAYGGEATGIKSRVSKSVRL